MRSGCSILFFISQDLFGVLLFYILSQKICNRIDGVMISVLTSSEVDRGCEAPSRQTKDFKIVCVASPLSTQQ
jgi:hypothetical protein